jgi:serine/threonine-protein kinase
VEEDEKPTRVKPIAVPQADPSESLLPPNAPQVLGGRYEILGLIGMGGMGAVYRARDVVLSEIVALKLLRPIFAADSESLVQFCQEVRLARRVTHKNVARTYDLGEADGQRFLTMELVEGQTLGALIEDSEKLGIARTIEIALAMCDGVGAAHDAGVVHRDLKPENVAITPDGRVVVMDFGIARHVGESSERAGFIVGTPEYMAPEQAQGSPDVDGRADQYAIGTMMFEMLTGQLPFPGPALTPILRRTMEAPPDPRTLCPEIPEALAKLVVRCLARARDDRFADLHVVATELRRVRGASESVPPSRSAPRKGNRAAPTLAVFPLDVTGHPESEHLGWAFAGGLVDALSSVPGLTIHPRGMTSSLSFTSSDPRTLGRRIGAEVVVHGTLRPAERDRFVAHVRVTTVEDGFQIWHRRIEGARSDVEKLADEAGRGIAESLGVSMPRVERVLRDAEVLDLFLRGRREYFRFTAESTARAQELLRLAAERAPGDPVVLAAYAAALGRQVGVTHLSGSLPLAREVAERARAAAPHAPEPMIAIASVLLQSGDAEGAARHVARALAIAPTSAEAHELAANLFFETGALTEGHAHLDIAVHLEPRLVGVRFQAGRAEALAGNWTEIERLVLGPVDPQSPFVYWADRFRLSLWRGDASWIDGVDIASVRGLTDDDKALAVQVTAILHERKPSLEARATLDAMRSSPTATDRAKTLASQLQAEGSGYCGDRDRCVTCVLAAVGTGLFDSPWLELCPALACARDAPELAAARATVQSRAQAVLAALRSR